MEKVKKILLPVDFSDPSAAAFRYAIQLADSTRATIEIVNVVFPDGGSLDYAVLVARALEERVAIAGTALRKFVDRGLTALGTKLKNVPLITPNVEYGTPVKTICDVAKRDDIDIIIIGRRGETPTTLVNLMGSVASGVVSKAPCSVIVVPEQAQFQAIESITYATALEDTDPFEIWKSLNLLKPFNPEIKVIHVNLKRGGDITAHEKLETMKAFFEERMPDLAISFHQVPGDDIQEELAAFITANESDLLVMHQPAHSFWDFLFHRSVTKRMALHTNLPLLVQKSN